MRRLSPTTIATLSGQKRPSDAAYEHLVRSLPPVDIHAIPQHKSLKRVYGPIRPPLPTDDYLENLRNTTLLNKTQKAKRYKSHVLDAWEQTYANANANAHQQPRIRFGKQQIVRIPKKTKQFKQEWKKLKQRNRTLKQNVFPNLALETDEDRTLTDQLVVDLPSDIEEETEAIVHSPTVVEEPIPNIPPAYTVHTFIKNSAGAILRIPPNEQTVDTSKTIEDLLVIAADNAEQQNIHPFETYIGVIDETHIFHPFEITYTNLQHKLYRLNKHLPDGLINIIYDLSSPKSGGKRNRKPRKK